MSSGSASPGSVGSGPPQGPSSSVDGLSAASASPAAPADDASGRGVPAPEPGVSFLLAARLLLAAAAALDSWRAWRARKSSRWFANVFCDWNILRTFWVCFPCTVSSLVLVSIEEKNHFVSRRNAKRTSSTLPRQRNRSISSSIPVQRFELLSYPVFLPHSKVAKRRATSRRVPRPLAILLRASATLLLLLCTMVRHISPARRIRCSRASELIDAEIIHRALLLALSCSSKQHIHFVFFSCQKSRLCVRGRRKTVRRPEKKSPPHPATKAPAPVGKSSAPNHVRSIPGNSWSRAAFGKHHPPTLWRAG